MNSDHHLVFLHDFDSLFLSPGLLRKDSSRHIRERSDSAFREVWQDLGPASHDGPHDRDEQGLRFRHFHNPRRSARSRQTGKEVCLVFRRYFSNYVEIRSILTNRVCQSYRGF